VEEGGISILIARQKEGKSMLSAQLAIDVSCGDPFLGKLKTKKGIVLYVDYENRSHRIKLRGEDLGSGRELTGVLFAAYDRISDRDLGLDGDDLERLRESVAVIHPTLLIIDPLRLATSAELGAEASKVVPVLERASTLQQAHPSMGILLVHHLKKGQVEAKDKVRLRDNPRDWIDRIYGSQALLAHVETIIGLEQDEDRHYTLATVPRSSEPIIWAIEKVSSSERFVLAKPSEQLSIWSNKLKDHWDNLPNEFSWTEGMAVVGNSTLDRIVRKATPLLLTQDPRTKLYHKVFNPN